MAQMQSLPTGMIGEKFWDRRDSESATAFRAFALYRDAGKDRSVRGVAAALGVTHKVVFRWSSKNEWVRRALAWDDHLDRIKQAEIEDDARQRARRIRAMGDTYLESMARKLKRQQEYEANPKSKDNPEGLDPPPDPIQYSVQGFVSVSRMLVELDSTVAGIGSSAIGTSHTHTLTAEEILSAHLDLIAKASNPREILPREVLLLAIERKFGRERMGLPRIMDAEVVEEPDVEGDDEADEGADGA